MMKGSAASAAPSHESFQLIESASSALPSARSTAEESSQQTQTLTHIKPRQTIMSNREVGWEKAASPRGRARSSERGSVARKMDGVGVVQGWLKVLGVEDTVRASFLREDMDIEAVLACNHEDFVRIGLEDKRIQEQLLARATAQARAR